MDQQINPLINMSGENSPMNMSHGNFPNEMTLQEEVRVRTATVGGSSSRLAREANMRSIQTEALARQAHEATTVGLQNLHNQQQVIVGKTQGYLEAQQRQHEQLEKKQLELEIQMQERLQKQQQEMEEEMRKRLQKYQSDIENRLREQHAAITEQYGVLQGVLNTTSTQEQKLQSLGEAMQKNDEDRARWGSFADTMRDLPTSITTSRPTPPVMVATGAHMPVPPMYQGSTNAEKRSFMDDYIVYSRRVEVLNQQENQEIFLMPLRACIEQRTLARICRYELGLAEKDVTEDIWRRYFLSASENVPQNLSKLQKVLGKLSMDVSLPDASSRVSRFIADYDRLLDENELTSLADEEQKKTVQDLARSVRPEPLRKLIQDQLRLQKRKQQSKSVCKFFNWLRDETESYIKFEQYLDSADKVNDKRDPSKKKLTFVKEKKKSKYPCLKCHAEEHNVFNCPNATQQEAKYLVRQAIQKRKGNTKPHISTDNATTTTTSNITHRNTVVLFNKKQVEDEDPTIQACVNGKCIVQVLLDSGADKSVISRISLEKYAKQGVTVQRVPLECKIAVEGMTGEATITEEVTLDLSFTTPAGTLQLPDVPCWVLNVPLPTGVGDILIGRDIMQKIGYKPEQLLENAVHQIGEQCDITRKEKSSDFQHVLLTVAEKHPNDSDESEGEWSGFPDDLDTVMSDVKQMLTEKAEVVKSAGAGDRFSTELKQLLLEYRDCFRLQLGRDKPVNVPPLRVKLKDDYQPVRCKNRKYPPDHQRFMRKHMDELIDADLVYLNKESSWCSPPLIVPKPGGQEPRMTIDLRAVNAMTERQVWPMPQLETVIECVAGSNCFFNLDFFKGYWQFPLHRDSQEYFSVITDYGVYSPKRVLMGGTDSVAYCQRTVQELFKEIYMDGLLVWLDDLLGYHKDEHGLLQLLKKVLNICKQSGLKLNPKKCSFFEREIVWCGKVISGDGVKHDPKRTSALSSMKVPTTGDQLQQFICAMNWMRGSIPRYNQLIAPLHDLLEKVYLHAGKRTRSAVKKITLESVDWNTTHKECWDQCCKQLQKLVTLAHPDETKELCLFADASTEFWGAVITQVSSENIKKPLADQDHMPLIFLSGRFVGSSYNWPIIEKEAYALIQTVKKADYLLRRSKPFHLFTDHKNLRYIFDPLGINPIILKHTAAKLQRWGIVLMGYNYNIHDIPGEQNIWADLLSRWSSTRNVVCAIRITDIPLSPMLQKDFVWPEYQHLKAAQEEHIHDQQRENIAIAQRSDSVWVDKDQRVWIPSAASELQLRICIIAHFGVGGHRGIIPTLENINKHFYWIDMQDDVRAFIKRCLHCAVTKPTKVNLPLGEAVHADRPGDLLHFDFIFMGKSNTGMQYILVIKDDASNFTWLVPCTNADSDTVYESLIDWFASFGICHKWVSDQGTHFKNEVVATLQHNLGAHHHFTTARCPWANGTVEVVNRELLRLFRALLSEWKIDPLEWPRITKIVQLALNQTRSASLAGEAPVTVMTGLQPINSLQQISLPPEAHESTITFEELQNLRTELHNSAITALKNMHKKVFDASNKARQNGRKKSQKFTMAQYSIGDYVLYAVSVARPRGKLKVRWLGPAEVVNTTSQWVFTIRDLITGNERECHASRMRFYWDKSLHITEDLKSHIAFNNEGHVVAQFKDVRYATEKQRYEVLISWRGLETSDDSWEPVTSVYEDVPTQFAKWLHNSSLPMVSDIKKALNILPRAGRPPSGGL